MSLTRLQAIVVLGSFLAVAASLAARLALGSAAVPLAGYLALIVLGFALATMLLSVFRNAPPPTIAQVLYDAEHPSAVPTPRDEKAARDVG